MMAHKMLFYLVLTCLCLAGCAMNRFVQDDNVFVSSANPPIKIRVSEEMKYIGKEVAKQVPIDYRLGTGGTFIDTEIYAFLKIDASNVLSKGVIIRFCEAQAGEFWPELFAAVRNKLTSGDVKINGKNYQFMTMAASNIFSKSEVDQLLDKRYKIPDCFMVKFLGRIAGPNRDQTFMIIYFEDIKNFVGYPCKVWSDANLLTDKQKQLLEKFEHDFARDIQILE
jgi:hypothetical protein